MLCQSCRRFSQQLNLSEKADVVLHETVSSLLDGSRLACHLCRMITAHLGEFLQTIEPRNMSVMAKTVGDNLQFLVSLDAKSSDESDTKKSLESGEESSTSLRFGIHSPKLPG